VLAASLGLAGCGSGTPASSATTVRVGATNWVTLAPTQSTNTPSTSGGLVPGTRIEAQSEYTVKANDYPSTVPRKFNVSYEDFMALNEFVLDEQGYLPQWVPGLVVKIPAGATVPAEDGTPSAVTTPGTTDPPTTPPVTTSPVCTSDELYTIAPGDAPANVASRFNTTIYKLNQANGGTKGFANFVVGTQIKIPVEC